MMTIWKVLIMDVIWSIINTWWLSDAVNVPQCYLCAHQPVSYVSVRWGINNCRCVAIAGKYAGRVLCSCDVPLSFLAKQRSVICKRRPRYCPWWKCQKNRVEPSQFVPELCCRKWGNIWQKRTLVSFGSVAGVRLHFAALNPIFLISHILWTKTNAVCRHKQTKLLYYASTLLTMVNRLL